MGEVTQQPTPQLGTRGERMIVPEAQTQPLIEDHALIGDTYTAGLVAKNGSIDFLCLPAFDSDACFASLLGTNENGHWTIAPTGEVLEVRRRYRGDTLILETDFVTSSGTLRVIDFMPPRREYAHIVRVVECIDGRVPVRAELKPRFAFGFAVPAIMEGRAWTFAFAGPDGLFLRGGPTFGPPALTAHFTLSAGDRIPYVLSWVPSWREEPPPAVDAFEAEQETEAFWKRWTSGIRPPARYRDAVVRSLITLKACTFGETGGIVAAPTTSLPETPGGERNWDYRFTWLRDASLTLNAFIRAGLRHEGRSFFYWTQRAIAGDPGQMQIMYGLRGERRLSEVELPWLTGYGGARPVRIGNGAYDQFQLDVLGEVAAVLYVGATQFGESSAPGRRSLLGIAEHVAKTWRNPDRGIWEMRGPERHFTASKVAAWTAIDRAIKALEDSSLERPDPETLQRLRKVRQEITDEVLREGFNRELNSFTQYYGGKGLDASLLFIPLMGFLPAKDPRVVSTVAALERELMEDGLLLRFRPEGDVDGLSGEEGVFLACSFWLVNTYQMMGRQADATALFERLLSICNDVGLLAEEYDTKRKRQLGNFPQAFSHFALVNSAYELTQTRA
jgi:GH15 family glucan-1,4-alpha-glucosidase